MKIYVYNRKAIKYIYVHLQYWQNLVKLMGRSLQVQIVNYLSILSLESSMDAQNNWFMHTVKVFFLCAKIHCGLLIFFKTWKCKRKTAPNMGNFSVMFITTKNKVSKCLTITIRIKNGTWKIDFQCQSIIWGEKGVFVVILKWICGDVHWASFPLTPVANAEVCTTTN